MRIEFEEVTPKYRRIKKIIKVILIIIFVLMFSILGIYYAKLYNFSFKTKKEINIVYIENEIEEIKNLIIPENTSSALLLPQYTEKSRKEMQQIYNSETKVAYLTFDDGPSQTVTPLILDVLKEQNVKATFFVLGSNVNRYPEVVKRAYIEGHYIANHGYTHNYQKIYKSAESVLEEYNKTEEAIQNAINIKEYSSHLFRFPGGYSGSGYKNTKKAAGKLLNKNDISYIDWNVINGDAEGIATKEKLIINIKKYTKDKGNIVILMHDTASKILTYETLTEIIQYLKGEGYIFENFYNIMK